MNRLLLLLLTVCVFASVVTASADDEITLAFRNSDVREVVDLYQRLTDKKIISDLTVQGLVNLAVDTPVSRDKAIELIEKTFFAHGYSLVDVSSDTIEVVGLARNPRAVGVPTYTKPDEIPKGERVFTYIFKLQHRGATEVQQLLTQHIAKSIYTSVIADPKSDTVVVTERTSVIRSLLPIVAAFDVPQVDHK